MASPYNYHWRAVIRPDALFRTGASFEGRRYLGLGRCERCKWVELALLPGQRSKLEIAHLDGDATNRDRANLAVLCRTCHRKHDHKLWCQRCKATRSTRKDRSRPLLQEARA